MVRLLWLLLVLEPKTASDVGLASFRTRVVVSSLPLT